MGSLDLLTQAPGLITLVVVVVVVAVGLVWRHERYSTSARPEWTLPTTEVFQDPETGRRLRVYVNPATGERIYADDPGGTPYPPLERPGLVTPPAPPQIGGGTDVPRLDAGQGPAGSPPSPA